MKTLRLPLVLCVAASCTTADSVADPQHNVLTQAEIDAGWELLFDGETTNGWRGWLKDGFPDHGWGVEDGLLVVYKSDGSEEGAGGDIITTEQYEDFELSLDFRVTPVANSGVLYRAVETGDYALWQVAAEFQVLDDTAYIEMGTMDMHKHLTGDNYDLHASTVTATNPVGEWNTMRIVANGPHVEHWLNGQKTVEYEQWSDEWNDLVAASKFNEFPPYGQARSGHIGLQDHGHRVEYRNIKIRRLTEDH